LLILTPDLYQLQNNFIMEFKIDTKSSYTEITPVTNHLNADLTGALCQKCEELTKNGSQNFIVDLHNCLDADKTAFGTMIQLHETCYEQEHSLVFTNLQDEVMNAVKEEELDLTINITPSMAEAIDIVSMEVLERDLFREG
jgi:anti-anti-sigma regulatory factor